MDGVNEREVMLVIDRQTHGERPSGDVAPEGRAAGEEDGRVPGAGEFWAVVNGVHPPFIQLPAGKPAVGKPDQQGCNGTDPARMI